MLKQESSESLLALRFQPIQLNWIISSKDITLKICSSMGIKFSATCFMFELGCSWKITHWVNSILIDMALSSNLIMPCPKTRCNSHCETHVYKSCKAPINYSEFLFNFIYLKLLINFLKHLYIVEINFAKIFQ